MDGGGIVSIQKTSKADREFSDQERAEGYKKYIEANKDTLHVSPRTATNTWTVRRTGARRALKRFPTQIEAVAFALKLAGDTSRIIIHDVAGQVEQILNDKAS
jgi:hypothetical protein